MKLTHAITKILDRRTSPVDASNPESSKRFSRGLKVGLTLSVLGCTMSPPSIEPEMYLLEKNEEQDTEMKLKQELDRRRAESPMLSDLVHLRAIYSNQELVKDGETFVGPPLIPASHIGPTTIETIRQSLSENVSTTPSPGVNNSAELSSLCFLLCSGTPEAKAWLDELGEQGGSAYEMKCQSASNAGVTCLIQQDTSGLVCGRRPPGLESSGEVDSSNQEGAWWAMICHLEEAAVYAFCHLAQELQALGAPEELVEGALEAMADEVKHVRLSRAMAQRHGVEPRRAVVEPQPLRGVWELAKDNATEGCIREAFAALEARWQARHCEDAWAASVLEEIGLDETRHGQLSWMIHDWLSSQLSLAQRQELVQMQQHALRALAHTSRSDEPTPLTNAVGLPSGAMRRLLAQDFAAALVA